ncbi:MAG: hypothetical protein WCO07_01400 [bacterium]
MTENKNEFKFGTLRNFGSEQFTFNAVIHSDKTVLTDEEIESGIKQIDTAVSKAFKSCQEREISEMALLADASERRTAEIKKRDDALKAEMDAKKHATETLKSAEKLSDKITKN